MKDNSRSHDTFLSKQDSTILYGIAILLMVLHHCFLDPERLHNNYISVFGPYQEWEVRFAWAGKLCVAIFAFLSGYAFQLLSQQKGGLFRSLLLDYKVIFNRGKWFYLKVLLVALIFIPVGVLFYDLEFSFIRVVRCILFGEYYNNEWWYIKQYLIYLLTFPIVSLILNLLERVYRWNKMFFALLFISMAAGFITLITNQNLFFQKVRNWVTDRFNLSYLKDYFIIFLSGALICRYRLFSRVNNGLQRLLPQLSTRSIIYLVAVFFVFAIRIYFVRSAAESTIDIFLCPFFVFFVAKFHHHANSRTFRTVFSLFGKYATFIWLSHTFFLYYYWQSIALLPRYSTLIYVWTVLISLLIAFCIQKLYMSLFNLFHRTQDKQKKGA